MLVFRKILFSFLNMIPLEEKSQIKDSSQYFYKSNYASPSGRSRHSSDKTLNDYLFSSGNPNPAIKSKVLVKENINLESDREKIAEEENEWNLEKKKLEEKLSKLFENETPQEKLVELSHDAFLKKTESVKD